MRSSQVLSVLLGAVEAVSGLSVKRQNDKPGFEDGQPIDGEGRGAPISGKAMCAMRCGVDGIELLTSDDEHRRHQQGA